MAGPEEVIRAYFEHFEAGDPDGVARLFTEDASFLANGMDAVVGGSAIRATFERIVATASIEFPTLSFNRVQDLGGVVVVETSTFERIRRRSADHLETGTFREVFVLTRSQDGWLISTYVGNQAKASGPA